MLRRPFVQSVGLQANKNWSLRKMQKLAFVIS
jgi:hypothetical protein